MPAKLGAAHWRARADEARTLAEQMNDADAKWRMLRIATDYDKIAKRAESAQFGHGIESISEHREHNAME